jgi:hypothetical protein
MKTGHTLVLVSGFAQTVMVWNSSGLDTTLVFARTLEDVLDMTGEHCKALFNPAFNDEPSDLIVSAVKPTAMELTPTSLSELNYFGAVLLPSEYRGQELNLN